MGILLPNIKSMEEFDELLMRQEELDDWCIEEPIKIQGKLKNRRIDKFIKMAIYCCQNALKTRKADLDAYDIGTVFNSIYGPEDSCLLYTSK